MSVASIVTDKILAEMKQGIIPWRKPWITIGGAWNRMTGRYYSLLNQILLAQPGEYASFKQWTDAGFHVNKGAKARMVTFYKKLLVAKEIEVNGELTPDAVNIPMLRYFNVFHVDDVEGAKPKHHNNSVEHNPIDSCERIINEYTQREEIEMEIRTSNEAFYNPNGDYVGVPKKEQFESIEEYYSSIFHELTHSTGTPKRLNRKDFGLYGGDIQHRASEELTAELGAVMLMNYCGLDATVIKNSTAYIQNWISELSNDPKMLIQASSRAEKAVKFILNIKEEVNG